MKYRNGKRRRGRAESGQGKRGVANYGTRKVPKYLCPMGVGGGGFVMPSGVGE